MGNKQKGRNGRGKKGREHGQQTGRECWLKADFSDDFSGLTVDTEERPARRDRKGRKRSPRRLDAADSKHATVDQLEAADRKRLARHRAAGHLPMAERVDKHRCYMEAVQLPSAEVHNLLNLYTELRSESSAARHVPTVLREDFCGTAILCREWVKGSFEREAYGVDIDPAVVTYAKERTLGTEGGPECERVTVVLGNVLADRSHLGIPKADIIAGLNYGVNYFKRRSDLMTYLLKSRESLTEGGCLIVDLFGGATVTSAGGRLFERRYSDFTYYFEQKPYDAMTNTSKVHLHFRFDDGSWIKDAYSYDFRAYTIVEIREAMIEAGFKSSHVWIAASTEEKEAQTIAEEEDEEHEHSEEASPTEESDDSDGSIARNSRHTFARRRGSGSTAGAYAYERIEGHMEQLQSWNAYVVGII